MAASVQGRYPIVGVVLAWLLAGAAAALELRLATADGTPLGGARVVVLGRGGTAVADAAGRATLAPDPEPPFYLLVTRPDGVALKPVYVEALPAGGVLELGLEASFAEAVTVMSHAAPDLEVPPAGAFTLLGGADLAERRPADLGQALEALPGTGANGNGLAAVPALRGLAAGRTLILLDDGRVTAERRAGPSATFLDPTTVEEIEVLRGPGSVAYGSDAFGGVIRARTRIPSPGEAPSVRYALAAGSGAGERAVSADVSTSLGGGGLLVGGSYRTLADYDSPAGEVPDSGGEFRGMRAGWQRPVAGGNLRLLWRTDLAREVGKPVGEPSGASTTYPKEDSHRFTASYERPGPGAWSRLAATLFWGRSSLLTAKESLATLTAPRRLALADVEADDWGARVEAERPLGETRLVVGVDLSGRYGLRAVNRNRDYTESGCCVVAEEVEVSVDDARRDDLGVFAAVDRQFGRLLASGGVRGDRVRAVNRGGWFGDLDTARSAVSGFAAGRLDLGHGLDASLQVSRGFRDALLSDRYYRGISGRGFITGNPDLEPETSRQLDLAVRYRSGDVFAAVYGYRYRIDELIERYKDGADYFFRNRGEAALEGVELEAGLELRGGLSVALALTAARGEVVGEDAWLDGIPARGAVVTVRGAQPRWGWWYGRVAAAARDERPGPTEVVVPGHAVVDAGVGVRLGGGAELALLARNLLDRSYPASSDEDTPLAAGRAFTLSLRGTL